MRRANEDFLCICVSSGLPLSFKGVVPGVLAAPSAVCIVALHQADLFKPRPDQASEYLFASAEVRLVRRWGVWQMCFCRVCTIACGWDTTAFFNHWKFYYK